MEGSVVCVGELGVAAMKCIACVAGGWGKRFVLGFCTHGGMQAWSGLS